MENMENKVDIPSSYFNKTYFDSITDGFSLFGETYLKIIPIFAILSILFLTISSLVMTDINWRLLELNAQMNQILDNLDIENASLEELQEALNFMIPILALTLLTMIPELFFSNFPQFLAFSIVGGYLYKKYLKKDVDFGKETKKSFKIELLIIPLIYSILVPIGFLLLFIPGLLILIFYIFAPTMHTIESEKGLKSFKASRRFSKSNFWRILGVFIIYIIVTVIISWIYTSILDLLIPAADYNAAFHPDTRNYLMIILYTIIYSLTNILLAPLLTCLLITLLVFCKKQKYSKDLRMQYYQQRVPVSGPTPYELSRQPVPEPQIESKVTVPGTQLFCPFCGFAMRRDSSYRFCPSCGEKIP